MLASKATVRVHQHQPTPINGAFHVLRATRWQQGRSVSVRSGLGDGSGSPCRVLTLPAAQRAQCASCVEMLPAAVDGWLDVAKLVSGGGVGNKSAYDELASQIGRDIYVDLAGWHLYLRDMGSGSAGVKMNVVLANQFGPQASKGLRESDISATLKKIPVKLGAGKTTVSLLDLMPSFCVGDLTRLVDDFGRRK